MSLQLLPSLRLLLLQSVMTVLMILPFQAANAGEVKSVSEQINSYIFEGDSIDLVEEMELEAITSQGEKVVNFQIKAQAIEDDAHLEFVINNKNVIIKKLSDRMKNVSFQVKGNLNLKKIEVKSNGAFVRIAKVDLVSDQPQDDDLSIQINQSQF